MDLVYGIWNEDGFIILNIYFITCLCGLLEGASRVTNISDNASTKYTNLGRD